MAAPLAWFTDRSRPVQLLLAGGVLAVLGFQAVGVAGRDPSSPVAHLGGGLLVVGQTAAVVGLALLAYRLVTGAGVDGSE